MLSPSAFRTSHHPLIFLTVTSRFERDLEGLWVLISTYYSQQAGLRCSTKFPPESFQLTWGRIIFFFRAILFMWKRWLRGTSASMWRSNISAWTVSSAWLEVSDKHGGWPPPYFSITQPCRTARGQVSELGHMGIWWAKTYSVYRIFQILVSRDLRNNLEKWIGRTYKSTDLFRFWAFIWK